MKTLCCGLGVCLALVSQSFGQIVQGERAVPVVRDADVVVVGGGSAAVSAAIAAKGAGAEVLLLAPRIGLGDDLTLTRELWPELVPEFNGSALACSLFALRVPYSYTYSMAWDGGHADTGYTRLTDGVRNNATSHSVQFNGSVTITAVFSGVGATTGFDLYYYKRAGSGGFDTAVGAVEVSDDGVAWTPVTPDSVVVETMFENGDTPTMRARVALPSGTRGAQVRVTCNIASGMARQLFDELMFQTDVLDPLGGSMSESKPLHVKRAMEAALDAAGVPFLTGAVVTDVLKDGNGAVAGVVMANRSGRQAVTARAVIDTTEGAVSARRAGAVMRPFVPGDYTFSRIVIADVADMPAAAGLSVSVLPDVALPVSVAGVAAPSGMPSSIDGRAFRCTFTVNLLDGSMLDLLEIEQVARDMTWVPTTVDAAERLVWMPTDCIVGQGAQDMAVAWTDAASVPMGAFRPDGVPYVFVLGVRSDVTRELAVLMRNPARMIALGERVGAAAAADALGRGAVAGICIPADTVTPETSEEVRERLGGIGAAYTNAVGAVDEGARELPVLAECDVLVVGAGTSGAPAAIAAARAGADTVVIDILNTMGGVQTDGRIGVYYHGNRCGFAADEIEPGWKATGAALYAAKAEWYRSEARTEGARILFGTLAAGAVVEGIVLKGAVVVLPDGTRGVIRAQTVVDATGSSVIALAAGEETEFIDPKELAIQGVGWARHVLGDSYKNTDVGFVDEQDAADVSYFSRRVHASLTAIDDWDAGANPASRERHRIRGAFYVSPLDILNGRTYTDTIVRPKSNFDSHGFTTHDLFFIRDPGQNDMQANLPYSALLPKTLDGLLVTGLGISAHRDAMPILRMQPDVENQGYAAGYAAYLAATASIAPRNISVSDLQDHLIDMAIIRPQDKVTPDSFPLPAQTVVNAAWSLTNTWDNLHIILTDTNTALPVLRMGLAGSAAGSMARERFATALGLLGETDGADWLTEKVDSVAALDTGWDYTGMGQYGKSVSWLDCFIITLGRTRAVTGLQAVLTKASLLTPTSRFSHYRAVSMALEDIGGGSAMMRLSAMLGIVRGHALSGIEAPATIAGYSNTVADQERNACLRELAVATALFRLGDDLAGNARQVLEAYAQDPRGVYAAYAQRVLTQGAERTAADGDWIGTAADAQWGAGLNWADGVPAGGIGAVAMITNAIAAPQTIGLGGSTVTLDHLVFAGLPRRVTDGILDIGGETSAIDVAAGSQATLAATVLAAGPLVKTGAGGLVLEGPATIGGLDTRAGPVAFRDADPTHRQAYSVSDTISALRYESGNDLLTLRVDFRVNTPITITGLGAFDSSDDGLQGFMKVSIYAGTGGNPLAALAFAAGETYPLVGGHRFRHLPEPLHLAPGEYAITTYGFSSSDGYLVAGLGGLEGLVGSLDGGGGAVTFLDGVRVVRNNALAFPADEGGKTQNEYGVTAGSFTYLVGAAPKTVTGAVTLPAGATLDAGAADVRLQAGVDAGAGATIANAGAAYPVSLSVGTAGDVGATLAASALGDRADGPLTLVKTGAGRLNVSGALQNRGGIHVANGLLEVDSPAAFGSGEVSFGTGGKLMPRAGGTVGKMLYAPSQSGANNRNTAFVVPEGQTVTFTRGIEPLRTFENNGFVIQPFSPLATEDAGTAETVSVFDGAWVGYIDLYLMGDGLPGGARARHEWRNMQGNIRKLASGHNTVDGSDIFFGAGCDIRTRWFDVAGIGALVCITNNAVITVADSTRFLDGGGGSQFSFDGGVLTTPDLVKGGDSGRVSKPVLFNGTVLRAAGNRDGFINLGTDAAQPLIRAGGAIIDTQGYSVGIIGTGFAQEPGSDGAFVKLGSGTLKIGAPMTYTGPTLVSNGTLRLDFALWNAAAPMANLLSPLTAVTVSGGASLEIVGRTNALGETVCAQALGTLTAADGGTRSVRVSEVGLTVNTLDGDWEKDGGGTLAFGMSENAVPFTGRLSVLEGTFAVHGTRTAVLADIPCPSFESDPMLPASPQASKDKRGAAATGCAGWTFADNNSGYQRSGSYFADSVTVHTTNGVQTAFIRNGGVMGCSFEMPKAANGCALRFQIAPRFYSNRWYTNAVISVAIDGVTVDSYKVTDCKFVERTVSLGRLEPGTHTLSFASGAGADMDTLIDAISIDGMSDASAADAFSSEDSELSFAAGVSVTLDYTGTFEVGRLVIGGAVQPGGPYSAATRPGIFTGSGILRVKAGGTLLILK